jgi:archaellum component FlaC
MVYPDTELDLQNRLDAEIDAHRMTKKERGELLKAMHGNSMYPYQEAECISPEVKDIIIKNNETLKESNNNLETAMGRVRQLEDNIERLEATMVVLREEANDKRSELDRLAQEEIELERERDDLNHKMYVTRARVEEMQEGIRERRGELEEMHKEIRQRRRELEDQNEIGADLRLQINMLPRQPYKQLQAEVVRLQAENQRLRQPPRHTMNLNDVLGRDENMMSLTHGRQGQPAAPDQANTRQASNSSAARSELRLQSPSRKGTQAQILQPDRSMSIHRRLPSVTFVDQAGRAVVLSQAMQEAIKSVAVDMMKIILAVNGSKPRMDRMAQVMKGSLGVVLTEALNLKEKDRGCLIDILAHKVCTQPKESLFACRHCFNSRSFCIRVIDDKLVAVQVHPQAKPGGNDEDDEDHEMLDNGGEVNDDGNPTSDWVRSRGGRGSQRYPGVW